MTTKNLKRYQYHNNAIFYNCIVHTKQIKFGYAGYT